MRSNTTITILGCGSSTGVPTIEGGWGNCNSNNYKNNRLRSSILVNIDNFNILVDTSSDLRYQALINKITQVDCILYTHEHADHISGVNDVRSFNRIMKKAIPCYLNNNTYNLIKSSMFNYVFVNNYQELEQESFFKPLLIPNIIKDKDIINLNNNKITIKVIEYLHGTTTVLGYIFNNTMAYITDLLAFKDKSYLNNLKNLDVLIISACVLKEHSSHITLKKVVELITNDLKPKLAYLTHMSETIDYETETIKLQEQNLHNIFLCYDGLKIKI